MVADLDDMKVEVVESQSFTLDPAEAVAKLKLKDVRIVLGNFNETWARRVLCEALRKGMIGRKHQWLLMGTYRSASNIMPTPIDSNFMNPYNFNIILYFFSLRVISEKLS